MGRTKDNNGYYVNFNYDAFGSVLSTTDSLSNPLNSATYAYGIAPFKVTSSDMDLGSWLYTVDPLGEVTAHTDANGEHFTASYDALSRPTVRTEPDLTTTWTWGTTATSHNIGQLSQVQAVSSAGTYTKAFGFDSVGRLSSDTTTLPTAGSFRFVYMYDTTSGLLHHIQYPPSYPSGTQVAVGYGINFGILAKLIDNNAPTTVYWQANSTNARGQVTQETSEGLSGEPQIVSNHTYDAVTGWLSTIQSGIGGGAALQNESYQYDELGNVIQRQNNNLGLTENIYYDSLYRLDHSILGSATNLQMGYDAMGNITSRSDVAGGASWTYDPTHKHQVTQAGSSAYVYGYDANGNVISRSGSAIGWTSYNYPSGVGTPTESATFDYGPDRQRWRMFYSGPSGTETTYYLTRKFEVVLTSAGTDYRHYLFANGKPVTVISRTTAGAVNVRSLLLDHQGSISSIVTDSTGTALVSESFTAYGSRREASTWSGAPTGAELTTMNGVTREGYTFQTVLGSMGLNHMNGRIEDSVTGRFLSPDPAKALTCKTQSWNRYTYVYNNPVTNVDPTGFAAITPQVDPQGEIVVTADRISSSSSLEAGGFLVAGGGGGPLAAGNSPTAAETGQLQEIIVKAPKISPPKLTTLITIESTPLSSMDAKEPTGEATLPKPIKNKYPDRSKPFPPCDTCGAQVLKGQTECYKEYGRLGGLPCAEDWNLWGIDCTAESCPK